MQFYLAALIKLWILATLAAAGLAWAGERPKLAEDGLHDPSNPALFMLQEANDIIATLPRDTAGTGINWDEALQEGLINPRAGVLPDSKLKLLNQDVIMKKTSQVPWVIFPHRQHTEWIACEGCHDELFASKAGATLEKSMHAILNGNSCGLCHGAVSFPLTECRRCHSMPRNAK